VPCAESSGDTMTALEVGKSYVAGRASIEPRVQYSFRAGQHELLLALSRLTEDELTAVRDGNAEFALFVYGLVIFFLYRFQPAIAWSAASYSWHLVPAAERQLPEPPATAETRALLSVVLVDADENIVCALRTVTFSPEFMRVLRTAITEQAAGRWDPEDYETHLHSAYLSWPTTEEMLSRAIARTKGGA
jgi:hypothetical protein